MELINLTPHPVTVAGVTYPSSGAAARLEQTTTMVGTITVGGQDIPIVETTFGRLVGLPDPAPGTVYVVSRLIAESQPDRADLLVPGRAVRDADGQVVGCENLARIPNPAAGGRRKVYVDGWAAIRDNKLVPADKALDPNPGLLDQVGNPRGSWPVHRQDVDGRWYVWAGPCEEPNAGAECLGEGYEMEEDWVSDPDVSYVTCEACWSATSMER